MGLAMIVVIKQVGMQSVRVSLDAIDYMTGQGDKYSITFRSGTVLPIANASLTIEDLALLWDSWIYRKMDLEKGRRR